MMYTPQYDRYDIYKTAIRNMKKIDNMMRSTPEKTSVDPYSIVKKVIFNNPATIVIWKDGSKTVVKCQEGDTYDREKGLALCFTKRFLTNTSRGLNDFLKLAEESNQNDDTVDIIVAAFREFGKAFNKGTAEAMKDGDT